MNYQEDLPKIMWENDKLRSLDRLTLFDIKGYIDTKKAGATSQIWWDGIKHIYVTESFRTIWSLSNALFELHAPIPIGISAPPLGFIECLYDNLKNVKNETEEKC